MSSSRIKEISAFDAKMHLSALIRYVEEGHSFTITHRGKPVARLEPVVRTPEMAAGASGSTRCLPWIDNLNTTIVEVAMIAGGDCGATGTGDCRD